MRLSFQIPTPQTSAPGFSLIELGLTMLVVSLALIPVVRMIGGPNSTNGNGSALQVSGIKNKETVLATSLANQVLGADYSSLTCGKGTASTLPTDTVETYKVCTPSGGVDLLYQWTVKPVSDSDGVTKLPTENAFYRGMLNVYKGSDSASVNKGTATPLLSMPVSFFRHTAKVAPPDKRDTGVLIALDRSASMLWSGADGGKDMPDWEVIKIKDNKDPDYKLSEDYLRFFGVPYLWYRYNKFPTAGTPTSNTWGYKFPTVTSAVTTPLDKWKNETLDMVYAQNYKNKPANFDPNPNTPNNEQYIGGQASIPCAVTLDSKWKWNSPSTFDKRLAYIFNQDWVLSNTPISQKVRSEYIQPLCQEKDSRSDWGKIINKKLSRFEAARSAALSLLLILEDRPVVRDAIELGFFPWAGVPNKPGKIFDAPLEKPSLARKKFETVRERLLWINRMDPADKDSKYAINTQAGTQIFKALQHAGTEFSGKNFKRRIVILMTDGQPAPNEGWNSDAPKGKMGLRQYAYEKIGCGAPKADQMTLFTIGLINADEELMDDMAKATPDGESFFAEDITDLSPIFESVAYQIQKLTLLNTSERYQLELADGVDASCDPAL